jgi:putative oxidoreductase
MDVGLLLLRLLLAGILLAHASQKALGWLSGPGVAGATAIFDKLGQHPPRAMVYLAVSCETVAAGLFGTSRCRR